MSDGVKFPSARQPVTMVDERGMLTFTRPWFLFFQQVYERIGGAIGPGTSDLSESLFEDAGTGETNAFAFSLANEFGQLPSMPQIAATLLEELARVAAEISETRARLDELIKEVDSIKQGQIL